MATRQIVVDVDDDVDVADLAENVTADEARGLAVVDAETDDDDVEVEYKTVVVTARVAAYWLERNAPNNRPAKPSKITKYARDMAMGRWLRTGDTIKVTADEVMVDGGQRMRAVLRAANEYPNFKSVKMTFAFGVPYDTIRVTDTGSARNFGDILKIEDGVTQITQVGSIVRRVFMWNAGNLIGQRGVSTAYSDPTMTELLDLYRDERSLFDASAARASDLRTAKVGNGTAGGSAYYILSHVDTDATATFFDHLVSGADLPERSAILTLRNRLIRANVKHSLRGDRADYLTPTEQLFFYLRTWNNWRRDIPVERLQLPDNRVITNENMPRPV